MITGVRSFDRFVDILPVVAGDNIKTILERNGYTWANNGGLFVEGAGTLVIRMAGSASGQTGSGGNPGVTRSVVVTAGSNVFGDILEVLSTSTATGLHVYVI